MKRIVAIFCKLLKGKKVFKPPQKAKILVYDGVANNLLEPLFDGEPYEVFYTRGERFNLSPIMICRYLKHLVREKKLQYSQFLA